jgi:hypothetical protein
LDTILDEAMAREIVDESTNRKWSGLMSCYTCLYSTEILQATLSVLPDPLPRLALDRQLRDTFIATRSQMLASTVSQMVSADTRVLYNEKEGTFKMELLTCLVPGTQSSKS